MAGHAASQTTTRDRHLCEKFETFARDATTRSKINSPMRLFEILNPPLYLFTKQNYAPGQIVNPSTIKRFPRGAKIEGWLEDGRPDHHLSRECSIFLYDRAQGNAPFIFSVEPIGAIERGHTGWLNALAQDGLTDAPLIRELVANYWAGEECPTQQGCWEYRVGRLRIVGGQRFVG